MTNAVDRGAQVHLDREALARFGWAVRNLYASEVGTKAKLASGALIALLLGINGLNVVNSYVNRNFMTAIEQRDTPRFLWWTAVYVGVFALTTLAAVFERFTEERLGLLWREWLTRRTVGLYLDERVYYRLNVSGAVTNPDQRIADDVRAFTVTTLSFVIMVLNSSFTVVAFSGVLWTISPLLFLVGVTYAACGSFLTVIFGRRLIPLNYDQSDREANFRADLIHVRQNAESVLLSQQGDRLRARLVRRINAFTSNMRRIIAINRNLGFFTTGYNYLIQIIPALIVAPLFIHGRVDFGVIAQSAMAFSFLVGAFSLIITQFQSISSFAAVVARLGFLAEAMEQAQATPLCAAEMREEDGRIVYQELTLLPAEGDERLLKDLSVSILPGTRVLIAGPNDAAKLALFRATAGIWPRGSGRISRPRPEQLFFLAERPYLPPATLRDVLVRTGHEQFITDEEIIGALRELEVEQVVPRAGGLDAERAWDDVLSLGEQQLLAVARVLLAKPQFVLVDRAESALNPEQVDRTLRVLSQHSITYVSFAEKDERPDLYDAVLDLALDGTWTWKATQARPG